MLLQIIRPVNAKRVERRQTIPQLITTLLKCITPLLLTHVRHLATVGYMQRISSWSPKGLLELTGPAYTILFPFPDRLRSVISSLLAFKEAATLHTISLISTAFIFTPSKMSPRDAPREQHYHAHPAFMSIEDVRAQLETRVEDGLKPAAIQEAQLTYGPNRLRGEGSVKWYSVLLKQISNAVILISFSRFIWGNASKS